MKTHTPTLLILLILAATLLTACSNPLKHSPTSPVVEHLKLLQTQPPAGAGFGSMSDARRPGLAPVVNPFWN